MTNPNDSDAEREHRHERVEQIWDEYSREPDDEGRTWEELEADLEAHAMVEAMYLAQPHESDGH